MRQRGSRWGRHSGRWNAHFGTAAPGEQRPRQTRVQHIAVHHGRDDAQCAYRARLPGAELQQAHGEERLENSMHQHNGAPLHLGMSLGLAGGVVLRALTLDTGSEGCQGKKMNKVKSTGMQQH